MPSGSLLGRQATKAARSQRQLSADERLDARQNGGTVIHHRCFRRLVDVAPRDGKGVCGLRQEGRRTGPAQVLRADPVPELGAGISRSGRNRGSSRFTGFHQVAAQLDPIGTQAGHFCPPWDEGKFCKLLIPKDLSGADGRD